MQIPRLPHLDRIRNLQKTHHGLYRPHQHAEMLIRRRLISSDSISKLKTERNSRNRQIRRNAPLTPQQTLFTQHHPRIRPQEKNQTQIPSEIQKSNPQDNLRIWISPFAHQPLRDEGIGQEAGWGLFCGEERFTKVEEDVDVESEADVEEDGVCEVGSSYF